MRIFGTETQESIATWANATFGPVHQSRTTLSRANIEMEELLHAIWVDGDDANVATEIADVIIVLCRYPVDIGNVPVVGYTMYDADAAVSAASISLIDAMTTQRRSREARDGCVRNAFIYLNALAGLLEIDLPAAIDAKMVINRARRWRVKGGHGQHIDPKELVDTEAMAKIPPFITDIAGSKFDATKQLKPSPHVDQKQRADLAEAKLSGAAADALAKADAISLSAAMYTTRHYVDPSAVFCNRANECPMACPCDPSCYCKSHTCRPR